MSQQRDILNNTDFVDNWPSTKDFFFFSCSSRISSSNISSKTEAWYVAAAGLDSGWPSHREVYCGVSHNAGTLFEREVKIAWVTLKPSDGS